LKCIEATGNPKQLNGH